MDGAVSSHTVAITPENFQQILLEESKQKLVFVDFWAEQMPESVELRDKLAAKTAGFDDHLIYATVDCQAQQQIAMQFGIQSLPTAVVVKDGQPIDGIAGPQTDETIQAFLDKHLPKPQDNLLAQAKQALLDQDANQAYSAAMQAYQLDSERADIKLVLADSCLQVGKIDEAEQLLGTIKMVDQDSDYQALLAKLELANQAADSPEIQALEAQYAESPDDKAVVQQLAAQYSQVNRHEDALTVLFRQVQKDRADSESKELLLDVLKALPDGDALATKFRRKLYTLMY
nr:tetratricopeptide repeat protein [Endozoicomonas sp. G2_1]